MACFHNPWGVTNSQNYTSYVNTILFVHCFDTFWHKNINFGAENGQKWVILGPFLVIFGTKRKKLNVENCRFSIIKTLTLTPLVFWKYINIQKVAKYGIRGTFYCHKISKKYTAYEALESMKRWIQGKKLGPSTIETVLFTKYSLFTHSKKPKMV